MKRFFRNIIILGMLAFGLTYAYHASGSVFEKYFGTNNPIPYITMQVQNFINNKQIPQTDNEDADDTSSQYHTFNKPSATVYIAIEDPTLRKASQDAIQIWNNTGSFTFKTTTTKNSAQIVMETMNDDQTNAAGLTSASYNSVTGYLVHAVVKLNEYYLLNPRYGYSNARIVNTAEHELGHAIGLKHTQSLSVMYPQGSYYTIQPRDVKLVEKIYHEKKATSNK
ncbi:matrixin family metalloprotease [Lactobacillus sp. PV037]|uniref:matrixin family metalloprotease n=1 Tax=Lactobacillus sp. PV037 TaxID=2594496 RepID=UPI002240B190|nr:matrixin family metalloprotease [Lactobacillus sp. PV037]QNQ83146.1 matrixin family metalloprotease [Lactobacillus sp. PV037]